MEYDYVLFMENGELFVRKNDYEKSISSFWEDHIGEKGKLRIENNELVFVPVSEYAESFKILRISQLPLMKNGLPSPKLRAR